MAVEEGTEEKVVRVAGVEKQALVTLAEEARAARRGGGTEEARVVEARALEAAEVARVEAAVARAEDAAVG